MAKGSAGLTLALCPGLLWILPQLKMEPGGGILITSVLEV